MPYEKQEIVITNLSMGRRIRLMRKAADMTQSELSRWLECSQGNISKIETDELSPSIFQLMCLRKVFGISADDFLDGRIDFAYIAYKYSNTKFLLKKYLSKEEAEENHQLELLRAA